MFKNWSIKHLLQLWAAITLIAVLVMGVMANYANNLMSETHSIFVDHLLPLESSSRKLSQVSLLLAQRQQQFLSSATVSVLSQFADRAPLENLFQENAELLTQTLDDKQQVQGLLKSLLTTYHDYLQNDAKLYQLKKHHLELTNDIKAKQEGNERVSAALLLLVDNLEKRLRNDNLVSILGLVNPLKTHIHQLRLLNYKLFLQTEDPSSFTQSEKQFETIFTQIEQDIDAFSSQSFQLLYVTDTLQAIEKQVDSLRVLMGGENGLIAIEKENTFTQRTLAKELQSSLAMMSTLTVDLNQLTEQINLFNYEEIASDASSADYSWWQIILVSILIMNAVMVFAYILIKRINEPLVLIKDSIRALSEGRFETRMSVTSTQNEVSMLARDLNHFAEVTQNLIADYSKAKVTMQHKQQQLRAILNGVPEAILSLSEEGYIIDINPAGATMFGGTIKEIVGKHLFHFFAEKHKPESIDDLEHDDESNGEYEGIRIDGSAFSLWISVSRILSGNDEFVWVCVIADITKWKQTNQQLHQMTSELNTILENAMVGIAFIRDRKVVRVNQKFEELFQYSREEIEGQKTQFIYPSQVAYEQFGEHAAHYLSVGESYEAQLELVRKNGEKFWCAMAGKSIEAEAPQNGSIWLFEDITTQRQNEERLTNLASVDSLTGLPNRNVFNDRLEHAIHKAHRDSGRLAVCFLDLDHFKHINDSLGHKAGDSLLREVAIRIKKTIREGDTVARLGGDEFTVILEDIRSAQYVGKVAEKIIDAMSQPYIIDNVEISISPSIGISLYPADGRDVDMLIRNADAAMYHAKKTGRNNFQFYSVDMNAQASLRLAMETALRRAVEQEEFFIHLQPQVEIETGKMNGAEVLLRWNSTQWGLVSPAEFIPILEDTGLIESVGEWVLTQACNSFLKVKDKLADDFKLAVNLSGRQFKGGNLASRIRYILAETGMPTKNLELEITETMLMEDPELATLTLSELSQMGISLAIDDFGTGYSSLSYLKQFPLNVLKIDSSFIRDVTTDKDDAAIVNAIMAMSESLGLMVVAEGVETMEQLNYLKQHTCQGAQGYLFSKPVSEDQFYELAQKETLI